MSKNSNVLLLWLVNWSIFLKGNQIRSGRYAICIGLPGITGAGSSLGIVNGLCVLIEVEMREAIHLWCTVMPAASNSADVVLLWAVDRGIFLGIVRVGS